MEVLITCLHLPWLFTPGKQLFYQGWLLMKEAMPGEERKEKKDMAPVQGRNVSAQEIKIGSMCFSLALSLPPCLSTCWITDQVQEIPY